MRKWIVLAILLWAPSCFAANWFVRPSGGSGSGTSWTAAWNGFSGINWGSVACGDTIWVAGGTYSQELVPNKNCASSSTLNIRRARSDATECTGVSGWSSGYDSQIDHTSSISFNSNYSNILISGRTTAAGGSYGWYLDGRAWSAGCGVCVNGGSTGNTIEYMDMEGTQGSGGMSSSDHRAIDLTPSTGSADNYTFSHLKIWNWESAIYAVSCSAPIFEYIEEYDITHTSLHPNGIITWGCPNGIVRYSKFHKGPAGYGVGEGVFFEQSGGSTNWQIYGNLFYDLDSVGLKAIEISSAVGAIKVYNNTFDNILVGTLYTTDSWSCTGGEWKNNLTYPSGSLNTCGTASNNLATSSTVFVNRASKDYHIVSTTGAGYPRNAGTNLGSTYQTDMDGITRGGDGVWDIGAYEYDAGGGGDTTSPTISIIGVGGRFKAN